MIEEFVRFNFGLKFWLDFENFLKDGFMDFWGFRKSFFDVIPESLDDAGKWFCRKTACHKVTNKNELLSSWLKKRCQEFHLQLLSEGFQKVDTQINAVASVPIKL